jgi:hypothetical protein
MTVALADVDAAMHMLLDVSLGQGTLREITEAVAWLDPLAISFTNIGGDWEHIDGYESEIVLSVLRECFPPIYAGALGRMRENVSYDDLDSYVQRAIHDEFAPGALWETDAFLDILPHIPVHVYGISFFEHCVGEAELAPDIVTVYHWFGMHDEDDDMPDADALLALIDSLEMQQSETASAMQYLIEWMFSLSEISLLNWTEMEVSEGVEWPTWSPAEVAALKEDVPEALSRIEMAYDAAALLVQDPITAYIFRQNIREVKYYGRYAHELDWTRCPAYRAGNTAAGHVNRVPARRRAAKAGRDGIRRRSRRTGEAVSERYAPQHRPAARRHAAGGRSGGRAHRRRVSRPAAHRDLAGRVGHTRRRAAARTGDAAHRRQIRHAA